MFRKAPPSTEAGLGIGLALLRYPVEAHGGGVAIKSTESVGTTVTIHLPILTPLIAASTTDAETSGPVAPCRILVVDDDADTVASMAMLLGLENHVVRTATSAKSALESNPELVGWTLVALTGDSSEADRKAALAAGFGHHRAKPVGCRR